MLNIVLAIHLIVAVLLIVVVLMQRSEGGGLGIGGGGNNGKSASLGKLDGLQRATWAFGAAFFVTSLSLTILAARDSGNNSLLEQLDGVSASEIVNQTDEQSNDGNNVDAPADPNAIEAPADPNASSAPAPSDNSSEDTGAEAAVDDTAETVPADPNSN